MVPENMADSSNRTIPWLRVLVEGVVIVVSILLAFGVQAWWEGQQERRDEVESLQLISRDLTATIEMMTGRQVFLQRGSDAAAFVLAALSGPVVEADREAASRALSQAMTRQTLRLPSAAYTDLVSTGGARVVSALRNEILLYYDFALRSQNVSEKGNTLFYDDGIIPFLIGGGLIWSTGFSENFVYRAGDPLWGMSGKKGGAI